MIVKLEFLVILSLISQMVQSLDVKSLSELTKHDLDSNESIEDLVSQESGKALVIGGGKENIIAKKGLLKGGKASIKKFEAGGKKLDKKYANIAGKGLSKKLFSKNKKSGAFGDLKKGVKKFAKVKSFNKIGGAGYKKKSFNVKSFNENKGFKFGKVKGFKLAKGIAKGVAKKGGKFKGLNVKGVNKKFKAGKKQVLALKLAKGGKKFGEIKKAGIKKGGKKFLKNKLKKGKKLKKIG